MEKTNEKASLRKILLEKRDSTSYDLMKISSAQIHSNLKKVSTFQDARLIGCYYPIGSEVLTQEIISELLKNGKTVALPKVVDKELVFKRIKNFSNLERGRFDIMEPKDECENAKKLDLILVPTIGITRSGVRLGYGYGFYDRYLVKSTATTIALTFAKQIVKSIPLGETDVRIDWIVTEDEFFRTS